MAKKLTLVVLSPALACVAMLESCLGHKANS